ncbi:sensor histidine kinase [Paenibacillus sp. S150]|uniref:sensor histidine kinase n=1 Tax=Paenibacillus sp. S150 TaxID=2749826 RepID=UPI001C56D187|nr:sensor histidine kinase [Paenibacillus sp. S150]MBW4079875.1 sensor histidine kinase [Paenibacillus sp. S150]
MKAPALIKKHIGFLLHALIGGSMWKRLLLFILAGTVVPFSTLTYYTYSNISGKLVEEYAATNSNSMVFMAKYLDGYYNDIKALVLNIYDDNTVFEYLKAEQFDLDHRKNVEDRLKTMLYSKAEIECIRFYTFYDQNMFAVTRNMHEAFEHVDQDSLAVKIPYLDRIDPVRKSYLSPVYTSANEVYSGTEIFTFNQAIFDIATNKTLAVLSYDINTGSLDKQYSMAGFKNGESLLLLNESNQVMYRYGGFELKAEDVNEFKNINYPNKNGYMYMKLNGHNNLVVYYKDPDSLYVSLKVIPVSILKQAVRSIVRENVELSIIFILAAVILVIFISNRMSLPVKKLAENMKKMETGKFNVRIDYRTLSSEFAFLFQKFNLMAEEINKLFNERYKLQLAQRSAELLALQAQINPHFLYNTLQTVQCMALKRDAYEINALVVALRDILKYCLKNSGDIVELGEEMDYVNKYLAIQKFRYLEDLEVIVHIEEAAKNIAVPKMILQPLIENCFIHGFENRAGRYRIELDCYCVEDICTLEITDNGKGMTPELVAQLEQEMSKLEDAEPYKRDGIGINNVNVRLKLLYKGNAGLKITSVPDVKTTIALILPIRERELHHLKGSGKQ